MNDTDFPNLSAMHRAACDTLGPLTAIRFKYNGVWHGFSWTDYRRRADHVAAGLIELGVQPGDRVAILSENRWEWLVVDHAILSAGAVDVPIHAPSTPAQIQYQLENSGASGAVVSTLEQWEKIASVRSHLPELRFVIGFDEAFAGAGLKSASFEAIEQAGQRGRRRSPRHRRARSRHDARSPRHDHLHQRHDESAQRRHAQSAESGH